MQDTADVIVVGGGVIGCAAAAELARAGAKTVLVERAELASGASGRNHGLIEYPQNEILAPIYHASHQIYRELAATAEIDIDLDADPIGLLIAVAREQEWAPAEAEAKACEAGGIKIERLDAKAIRQTEPNLSGDHIGGFLIDDGYRLDPAALTLALAEDARRNGAEVLTHTDVKQVLVRNGRVTGAATDRGPIHAPVVVDAAGPWAPKLARSIGADLPVFGARGWILLTQAAEPIVRHIVLAAGWHVTEPESIAPKVTVDQHARGDEPPAKIGLVIQQNRSGHILMGGTLIPSLGEDPEGTETTREIARSAIQKISALAGVRVIAKWSGVRPMTPDGLPIIGPLPGIEGLFVAGGHGGQGVILGGGTGRLTAQMILGAPVSTDPAPFSPSRF